MVTGVPFYPYTQVNGAGLFGISTEGYVQGDVYDDPASRNWLQQGIVAATETLPMWGGVGIYSNIPSQGGYAVTIGRATALTNLAGFSTSSQAANWVQTATSPVPVIGSGGTAPFYRFGSNARIQLAIDPILAANLQTGVGTNTAVSWDFTLQRLVQGIAAYGNIAVSSVSWSAGVVTVTTSAPHGLTVNTSVTLSGFTPAGYNGTFDIVSVSTSTSFTYALATNPGSATVQGQVNAGGGILPVRVLDVDIGNSMTVTYNTATSVAAWNKSSAVALVQI